MRIYAPLISEPTPLLQEIEVATFFQLPSFQIIGLPSPEVAEAKERVRSAIEESGIEFPKKRVIVNLSPASIRKRGTGLDLGMALAILAIGKKEETRLGAWGELGLDGTLKASGQLTRVIFAAWQGKLNHLILSSLEYDEGLRALACIEKSGEIEGTPPVLIPASSLTEAWKKLSARSPLPSKNPAITLTRSGTDVGTHTSLEATGTLSSSLLPLSPALERVCGVAAAGHHHFLLLGPRGTGKSHTLEWFIALQPPMAPSDRLHQALLAEMGQAVGRGVLDTVPIRRVSSQVRPAALVGGASTLAIRPGEFSLAHGGVLIADELPEWARDSREALREPLERGKITLTRAQGSIELPSRFLFAANGNLCPCGGWPPELPYPETDGVQAKPPRCKCTYSARRTYLAKLSGPLLDRIDLVSWVVHSPLPSSSDERQAVSNQKIESLRSKVAATRENLISRWGAPSGLLSGVQIEALLKTYPDWMKTLSDLDFGSLRSRHKVVRLALTLSAWDELSSPTPGHFMEAYYYRPERILS